MVSRPTGIGHQQRDGTRRCDIARRRLAFVHMKHIRPISPSRMRWIVRHDAANILRYGRDAPLLFERVWFDPQACTTRTEAHKPYRLSGQVIGGDWDIEAVPFADHPVARACRSHWVDGVSWEGTGIIDWLLARIEQKGRAVDRCRTREDAMARYQKLDRLFEQVRSEGRLRTRRELGDRQVRERGAIRIDVGRDAQPILSWAGHHRLVMAQILELPRIPGQLQVVHPGAIPGWRAGYRRHGDADPRGITRIIRLPDLHPDGQRTA